MRAPLVLLPFLVLAAPAQSQERSLWDIFHPDRIVTQVLHSGLFALRTQMDVTYEDLSVSVIDGRVAIEGLDLLLPPELTGGAACAIGIGALDLVTTDPFDQTRIAGQLTLRDLDLPHTCLGPDAAPVVPLLPGDRLIARDVTIDFTYHIPSAAFTAETRAAFEDLAAVTLITDFNYLWFRGEEPDLEPVASLSHMMLSVTNLGGWEIVAPLLPPPLTNPDQAAAFVTQAVGGQITFLAGGTPSKAAKAFVPELAEGWSAFITEPKRLVIESGFSPAMPRPISADLIDQRDRGPLPLIDLLEPRVSTAPAAERDTLDPRLVRQALDAPETLTADVLRDVGLALLTGSRAPRNRPAAQGILVPLAEAGDGDVALALARALADANPEEAYAQALAAGPTAAPGLRSLLDRLEATLPFATILRLQYAAPEPSATDLGAPPDEMRARAEAHLTGMGAPRSLRSALIYASIASARGDRGATRLLARIDRAVPADGQEAWAPIADEAATIALRSWLNQ